jgi:hypothetical protein
MTATSPYSRILRRETHSPRSAIAITLAVLLILVLAWIGTESVLALLGQPALLVAPVDALTAALALPTAIVPGALIAAGVVVALVGLLLVVLAILPGRRARHTAPVGRTAVVVDNTVVASALARTASGAANIDPDQVVVTVGHRSAIVSVRPTSGFAVDEAAVTSAVRAQLELFDLTPALRVSVVINKKGVVGA